MESHTGPAIDFRVFGRLRVIAHGRETVIAGRNPRIVLAVLVCNRGRLATTSALCDAIWGPTPPENYRNNIQAAVSKVRSSLQSAGLDPASILPGSSGGYTLTVRDRDSDVGRFHASWKSADRCAEAGDLDGASRNYAAAVAEVDAMPLSDLDDCEFAQTVRREMRRSIADLTIRWARVEIELERPERVLNHLRTVAADNPQNEPLQYETIRALYVCDMQAEALETYHTLKSWLDEYQGIDPGPRTQDLYRRILNQEPLGGARPAAAGDVVMTDIGIDTAEPRFAPAVLVDVEGNEISIPPGTLRLGRDPSNHVVLGDRRVSARHAAIRNNGHGFVISDQNSTNGTFVGGVPVVTPILLTDGDVIRIGRASFTFRLRLADD